MDAPARVVVWDEGSAPRDVWPEGLGSAVAAALRELGVPVTSVIGPRDPDQGTSPALLAEAGALVWWSHHETRTSLTDRAADRVFRAVADRGMGLVVLHSGYLGKPFRRLMGTSCEVRGGAADGGAEEIRVLRPDHPLADGIADFMLEPEERYEGPWDVPPPEAVVLESRFRPTGGTFPAACAWTRGNGRVAYLRPGHETYRSYDHPMLRRLLANACRWASRSNRSG